MQIKLAIGQYLMNGERAINLHPVNRYDSAIGKYIAFLATEGLELFAEISGQPLRGLYVPSKDETKMYAVIGKYFYQILTNGYFEQKGTLNTSQGLVEMSDNGDDGTAKTGIFISDGQYGYTYQPTLAAFDEVTDPDFPGAASNTFLDGYTVIVEPRTQKVYSSALYDYSAWDALDFSSAESDPDDLLKVVRTPSGQLMLLGRVSTEFFYNAGLATGFPFERISGARFGYGLAAINSYAWNDQAGFFLARTTSPAGERVIVKVSGYQPTIVSPQGLNEELAKLSDFADAEGFAYMRDGHSFYEISFPRAGRTFVVDASNGLWHERSSTVDGVDTRHRARCYAYFNRFHMVGDYSTGKIYKLRSNVFNEAGQEIKRTLYTPELTDRNKGAAITIPEIFVPMKAGVGDGSLTDHNADPKLMFRYSKDGGKSWAHEKLASIGKQGQYSNRVKFNRLGQSYQWNFELSTSAEVDVEFCGPLVLGE